MIVLGVQIENKSALRKLGVRLAPLLKQALQEVARYWHLNVFPKHFYPSNRARYQLDPRNPAYLKEIKLKHGSGPGKYVDELLSGKSRRWMMIFAPISGTSRQATIRMKPPAYFTNPFIGTFVDPRTGKRKTITHQPDKADEVTRVNDQDRAELRQFMQQRIVELVNQNRP